MTKTSTKNAPPIYCFHHEFNPAFPADYQASLTNTLQRSKRGVFPGFTKLQGKRSPPIFVREEILNYAIEKFSRFYPEAISDVAKALGLQAPKKKKQK